VEGELIYPADLFSLRERRFSKVSSSGGLNSCEARVSAYSMERYDKMA